MVAPDAKKKMTRRKLDVKSTNRYLNVLAAGLLAGWILGLTGGCSSPSPSQKVYDRYAELVASRNQMAKPLAEVPKAPAKPAEVATRPVEKPVASASAMPSKASAPAASRAAPAPKGNPAAPVPATAAAPVQIVAPPSALKSVAKPVESPVAAAASATAVSPTAPAVLAASAVNAAGPAIAPVSTATTSDLIMPNTAEAEDGYVLKVGDGVQIYLRGIPAPEVIEDVIDEGGKVTLPLINEVQAAGLAVSDLERNIRQIYLDQDIYRNITVNVVVPTRYYFILGEVKAGGRFQIMSATRVSQAIAAAGGYTEYASGKVQVKRNGTIFKVIQNARRLERTPADDILLEPDDVVEVLRSWF